MSSRRTIQQPTGITSINPQTISWIVFIRFCCMTQWHQVECIKHMLHSAILMQPHHCIRCLVFSQSVLSVNHLATFLLLLLLPLQCTSISTCCHCHFTVSMVLGSALQ